MNRIMTTPRGFPFDARTLAEIQNQTVPALESIARLLPNNSRLWGVEVPNVAHPDSRITDGFIIWHNEFLPFIGGPLHQQFSIIEEVVERTFNVGTDQDPQLEDHPAYVIRYATPGIIEGAEGWYNISQLGGAPKLLNHLGAGGVYIGSVFPYGGRATPDHSGSFDTIIDVTFPEPLTDFNYLIIGSFYRHSLESEGSFDYDVFDRQKTGFKLRIKNVTDEINDLFYEYLLIPYY